MMLIYPTSLLLGLIYYISKLSIGAYLSPSNLIFLWVSKPNIASFCPATQNCPNFLLQFCSKYGLHQASCELGLNLILRISMQPGDSQQQILFDSSLEGTGTYQIEYIWRICIEFTFTEYTPIHTYTHSVPILYLKVQYFLTRILGYHALQYEHHLIALPRRVNNV